MTHERIVVAAATFNRPAGLAKLLDGLAALRFEGERPDVEIVIVDNSADANAQAQVEARASSFPVPLHFRHEPARGIAQVRNRALDAAIERNATRMAFIDDDEWPAPEWLERMLDLARSTGATVVVGAVQGEFEGPHADWMRRGGFFDIVRYEEGAELDFGNTSNVLFDLGFVRRHAMRFDLRFSLTGGEDTLFFDEILARGGTIRFCRSGVVFESIVPSRSTAGWLLKRWRRTGNTDGRIVLHKRPGLRSRVVEVFGGGAVRFGVGAGLALATSPLALVGRAHVPAEHLRVASRGLGFMMSAFGRAIEEYRVMTR